MKRLCTVCARGGSKGVPGKNIRPLLGRPLIAHTVSQAAASGLFAAIAVTSDATAVLDAGTAAGADYAVRRPAELASDFAPKVPAIVHCLLEVERQSGMRFDSVCDLDVTAPLRSREDIGGAIELSEKTGAKSVVSGAPARKSPYFNIVELGAAGHVHLSKSLSSTVVRRQDAPPCFELNGSVYVWRRDAIVNDPAVFYDDTRLFMMPEERSYDIDSELDWDWVAFLMERRAREGAEATQG